MPRRTRGFSLLEVIVALVLLASTGVALFAWISQNLAFAARLRDTQLAARLMDDARALVSTVNPLLQPEGLRTAGTLTVSWKSSPLQPVRGTQTMVPGVTGPWQAGLFTLDVSARDAQNGANARFDLVQVGLKRLGPSEPAAPAR